MRPAMLFKGIGDSAGIDNRYGHTGIAPFGYVAREIGVSSRKSAIGCGGSAFDHAADMCIPGTIINQERIDMFFGVVGRIKTDRPIDRIVCAEDVRKRNRIPRKNPIGIMRPRYISDRIRIARSY